MRKISEQERPAERPLAPVWTPGERQQARRQALRIEPGRIRDEVVDRGLGAKLAGDLEEPMGHEGVPLGENHHVVALRRIEQAVEAIGVHNPRPDDDLKVPPGLGGKAALRSLQGSVAARCQDQDGQKRPLGNARQQSREISRGPRPDKALEAELQRRLRVKPRIHDTSDRSL
ncbi:hypothetical protein D3C87_1613720 [compost metagenome]